MNQQHGEAIDWAEALQIVRRRWATLLLAVVVFGGGVLFWSEVTKPEPRYRASAQVLLELRATNSPFKSSGGIEDPRRAMSTEIARLTGPEIQAAVLERVPRPAGISANGVGETDIFAIDSVSADPQLAADTANAYAEAYVEQRRQRALDAYQVASDALQERMDGFDQTIADLTDRITDGDLTADELAELQAQRTTQERQRAVVEQKLIEYQVDAVAETGGSRVFRQAFTPSAPYNTTRPFRSGLLGAFAGGVLGLVALVILEHFDDRVRNPRQVSALAGLPVLGVVPAAPPTALSAVGADAGRSADPYRHVRSTLLARAEERPLGVLLVSSASGGEDTATTALNMALAFARSGRRVVLVSTDFGDGPLHDLIRLPDDRGLATVVGDNDRLMSVVLSPPETPNLMVLPAGPLPFGVEPADLLATREIDLVFTKLAEQADLVIVECPPVLESAVTSTLARLADAVVVVARLGKSTRHELREALTTLAVVDAPAIGFVVHEPHRSSVRGIVPGPEDWHPVARRSGAVGYEQTPDAEEQVSVP